MIILKKGKYKQLSENLNQREVDCRCIREDCTFTIMSKSLIIAFQELRASCGNRALRINSGFRCQKHNEQIGGAIDSRHKMGHAIDISRVNQMDIEEFGYRARNIFDLVIVYKDLNFIHCHQEPFKFTK